MRAERQTAGRGRLGRRWSSEAGNLHISTLVRLRSEDPPAPQLALLSAVATWEAVVSLAPGVPVAIKWPNDLIVDGAKLCGTLLERQGDAVVVGIGLNIAYAPQIEGRATTCLAQLGVAPAVTAAMVAEILSHRFGGWLARWRREGLGPVAEAWCGAAHPVGSALRVNLPNGHVVEGCFQGLSPDGALNLSLADGRGHVIHAGDVFMIEKG